MKTLALILATALFWASHATAQVESLKAIVDSTTGITYRAKTRQITASTTLLKNADHTILADASAGAITITLPAAGTNTSTQVLVVKKTDSSTNAVTLDANGTEKIDGALTLVLPAQNSHVVIQAGFSGWHVLGGDVASGDVVLSSDLSGGNLGAANTLTALPNLSVVAFGTMTNGSTETTSYMDDTPAAEWGAAGGTVDPTDTEDTSYARIGSKSLKLAWAAGSVAGDGVKATITSDDLEANESVGMWLYVSEAISAGDLTLVLTDDGGARTFNIPAVATASVWTWVEVDISSLAAGTGDAITEVAIKLSSAGATAHAAFNTYVDGMVKWDGSDELPLGVDVLDQPGAVRGFLVMTKADAGTTAHTPTSLVDGTDYFIHRESGNDFLVQITNQSANCGWCIVAHK